MIKIAINGINGTMGRVLTQTVLSDPDLKLVCGFDAYGENDTIITYKSFKECELVFELVALA